MRRSVRVLHLRAPAQIARLSSGGGLFLLPSIANATTYSARKYRLFQPGGPATNPLPPTIQPRALVRTVPLEAVETGFARLAIRVPGPQAAESFEDSTQLSLRRQQLT